MVAPAEGGLKGNSTRNWFCAGEEQPIHSAPAAVHAALSPGGVPNEAFAEGGDAVPAWSTHTTPQEKTESSGSAGPPYGTEDAAPDGMRPEDQKRAPEEVNTESSYAVWDAPRAAL